VFIGALAMGVVLSVTGGFRNFTKTHAEPKPGGLPLGWLWFPGIIFAGDFWAWHWSFEHTSVANSTLLANTAILWVTLFAWLVWKEKITSRFVFGALIAFGGMVLLVISSSGREPPRAGNPVFGDFLALLTAVFYASYQLSMKRYRRERPAPQLMFCASAVAALVLLPLALIHKDAFLPSSPAGWWPLIGLGVVSHACGQGLIAWSLGGLPSSLASVILLVQPVATAFLGKWILGQKLVPWQIAGACLVLLGLFFAIRGNTRRARNE
ncbi:MAG: DMT family transporter, partial [Verrucomicrobiales bacterium]|nr:DMT family transporter [Verrucomicrobiales bacterium]